MGISTPSEQSAIFDEALEPESPDDDDDDDDDEELPHALIALEVFTTGSTSNPRESRPLRSKAGMLRIVDDNAHGGPMMAKVSAKPTFSRSWRIVSHGIESQRKSLIPRAFAAI